MKNTCEIADKISKINNQNQIEYGKEMLTIVAPDANDFIIKMKSISDESLSEAPCDFDKISQLPFCVWINKQAGFKQARKKMIDAKLINASLSTTQPITILSYSLRYAIEFVTANAICQLANNIHDLRNAVFVPIEWKKLAIELMPQLTVMSRNFELGSMEQLFLYLLNELQNSKGSIYNSGKPHDLQVRELLIKRIMQGFFCHFGVISPTDTFVADTTLNIVGVFFDEMKRNDAIKLAGLIRKNVAQETSFLQQKVMDLLLEQSRAIPSGRTD
jgi:hypothetical protein